MNVNDLRRLRAACVSVADDQLLTGCCAHVAVLVRGIYGGDIIEGRMPSGPHFWNRLPCGTEIDLTSTQFGGDGWSPVASGSPAIEGELIGLEHLAFGCAVVEALASTGQAFSALEREKQS